MPAGCWEHTESGTPCFALRRRRARRPGRAAPVRRPRGTADRTSAAARLSRRDRSTTLNRTCLSPDNRTVHSSHSFSRQYLSVRNIVSRRRVFCVERAAGGGRALCLSSEPSDQGEITSVVAKRKSNERTSFDHLQGRIPQSTDHTWSLGPAADWQHADLHLNLRLLCAQRYPPSGQEIYVRYDVPKKVVRNKPFVSSHPPRPHSSRRTWHGARRGTPSSIQPLIPSRLRPQPLGSRWPQQLTSLRFYLQLRTTSQRRRHNSLRRLGQRQRRDGVWPSAFGSRSTSLR